LQAGTGEPVGGVAPEQHAETEMIDRYLNA
jgi:hypothetical protein